MAETLIVITDGKRQLQLYDFMSFEESPLAVGYSQA